MKTKQRLSKIKMPNVQTLNLLKTTNTKTSFGGKTPKESKI